MEVQPLAQAFALRQQKNYPQALVIYQPLWQQQPNLFDDWAGWSYAYCLKETSQYNAALDVCRQLYARFPAAAMVRQLYAGCIYYTQFDGKQAPAIHVLKKAVQAMYNLSPPQQDYSLTPRAIFKLVKLLANSTPIDWQDIESWLQKLDPDLLNDKPFAMKMPDGKQREFASPVEEWYSAMIKVKAGLNQPQELLILLEAARKRGLKWHYNNNIWFARKEAFAFIQLGQKQKAEKILRTIVAQKKDWFLLSDLAEIVNDPEEAMQLMSSAALASGPLELKVKLFHNLYLRIKDDASKTEATKKHLLLIARIRLEQGWPFTPALEAALQNNSVDLNGVNSAMEAYSQLKPFWRKAASQEQPVYTGIIEKILEGNQSGFVKATGGKRYYFLMRDVNQSISKAIAGVGVSFELQDGFDKKKQQATKNAVRLTIK